MGVRVTTGYIYKCNKCGHKLYQTNFILSLLFPIRFGYIIKKCPNCGNKYRDDRYLEFFNATKNIFHKLFFFSLFFWILLVEGIVGLILSYIIQNANIYIYDTSIYYIIAPILFTPAYYFILNRKWHKDIQNSIKRINNSEYLIDLVSTNFLTMELVDYLYTNNIINKENYDKVKVYFNTNNI